MNAAAPSDTCRVVLVVEDDVHIAWAACELLNQLGFATHHVASADAALRLLEGQARFIAVMTDHQMPGMSGNALAGEIRRRWPALPVFIVSGSPQAFDVPSLRKPFTEGDLRGMLDQMLRPSASG